MSRFAIIFLYLTILFLHIGHVKFIIMARPEIFCGVINLQQTDLPEVQKLIEKIDGVLAAKPVVNEQGDLVEIHVLADRSRPPKQMSRDIQSAVSAATGEQIEHKIISIAQIGEETAKPSGRLKIESIEVSSGSGGFNACVTLSSGSKTCTGKASGISGRMNRCHAVAAACINAIHDFISENMFYVSDVMKVRIANSDEINVAVCCLENGTERVLTGTALIKDDEYQAVARATLNAVNRVLIRFPG